MEGGVEIRMAGVDMGGLSGYGRIEWIWEEGVDMRIWGGGLSGYGRGGGSGFGRREWIWEEGVDMGGGSGYGRREWI